MGFGQDSASLRVSQFPFALFFFSFRPLHFEFGKDPNDVLLPLSLHFNG